MSVSCVFPVDAEPGTERQVGPAAAAHRAAHVRPHGARRHPRHRRRHQDDPHGKTLATSPSPVVLY